ncbi:YlbG family protein [Mammaliicoccus sciuri]|uniref:YlbG family protein n=1 Tax=Mammaliicoccus sciuri TaxID=1296 RepID=UPI00046F1927|nr:YlbG family protein [Mammaliicoccus sciuri]MCJ0911488.1 YlbG family protein [Mammaliicoccus sciuri]MCJ0966884.1 YlbG family protein [Mammaliicoccus sciuri]MEB5649626.1 YlbG family protein [Mammaliicoccus sciuri]MEB6338772.1 YlbG family protein [Mammaliicoccus sciuri]MEB6341692.1 YlbG family protein [Mammaliicoccus sciuri]
MELVERISIVVYLKNMKHERQLRKFGNIYFAQRKEQYVMLYTNEDKIDDTVQHLMKLKYVKDVKVSPFKYVKRDYSNSNTDKKEYLNF